VDVRFHKPWSLRDFLTQQVQRIGLAQSLDSRIILNSTDRGRVLRALGYRVLSDINDVSVIMPTALVGTVLLTLRGRGVGKEELVRRVEWLSERVRAKGGRVAHFYRAPTSLVVDRALEALGPKLVREVNGLAEPTYYAVDRFQLSFYRNMTIHLFIPEALVSAAMYIKIKQGGGPANQQITYDALLDQVSFLSQVCWSHRIYESCSLPNSSSAASSFSHQKV
jgi:glycerol-3-phosphate O-acyltransferase